MAWTDTVTALGTAGAAIAAAAGLFLTMRLASQQRRDARGNLADERANALALAREERQHAAREAQRRHLIDTLLRAAELYGDSVANQSVGNLDQVARLKMRAYVLALPDDLAACLRRAASLPMSEGAEAKYDAVIRSAGAGVEDRHAVPPQNWAYLEVEQDLTHLRDGTYVLPIAE